MTGGESRRSLISRTVPRMIETFDRSHPDSAHIASSDPGRAISAIRGLNVVWTERRPRSACELGGVYDNSISPPQITIMRSGNDRRDWFTALHELGHHILAWDEIWQYQDRFAFRVGTEEEIANAFAAQVLIPEDVAARHLEPKVDSRALVSLMASTVASPTACCVRALQRPGDRLIILAGQDGQIFFSSSNGEPWNPGKKVRQPALERAFKLANEAGGSASFTGGHGLLYASGRVNTDVKFDASIIDDLLVAVCTSIPPDERLVADHDWHAECAQCSSTFSAASTRRCSKCESFVCPDCGACDCTISERCANCGMLLSCVDVAEEQTSCEDCRELC